MIKLSIIIVNYKSWLDLKTCLTSLKEIYLTKPFFEVFIVDNNSNDGILNQFSSQFPEFKFILNSKNYGFAQACNLGAQHSQGEYFLFLNPDTIISQPTMETLLDFAQNNPQYKLVSCNKINEKGTYEKTDKPFPSLKTLFGLFRAVFKKKTKQKNNIIFPDWLSGSLILVSQNWFNKIGGWNEDYWMYYEDVDLSKKTSLSSGKIALLTDIEIFHKHGGASRSSNTIKALTKTETIISKHVYIHNNIYGIERNIAQILLVSSSITSKAFLSSISLILFFHPKLRVNTYIFKNLIKYYFNAIKNSTWISPRSIKFNKEKV